GREDAEEVPSELLPLCARRTRTLTFVTKPGGHRARAHRGREPRHVAEELLRDPTGAIPRERLRADHTLRETSDRIAHLEVLLRERELDRHRPLPFLVVGPQAGPTPRPSRRRRSGFRGSAGQRPDRA